MADLELRLAGFKHLLWEINLYQSIIDKKDYTKFLSKKYKQRLDNLKNSINGEISNIEQELRNKGIDNPTDNFSFNQIRDILSDLSKGDFESLMNDIKNIRKEIQEESMLIHAEIIKKLDKLPEWLFPTSTSSICSDMETIKLLIEDNSSLEVDKLFETLMDDERIKDTFNIWEQNQTISNRINILKEAIKAHIDGKFYLSVSTLIPQIEGLLRDALGSMDRNNDFDSMSKDDMKRGTNALIHSWKSQPYTQNLQEATSLLDSIPEAVSDLYDKYEPDIHSHAVPGKLFRHGVCHGNQTDFGRKKNSLRLILILDRIIFFYEKYQQQSS